MMTQRLNKALVIKCANAGVSEYHKFWYGTPHECFWCERPLKVREISLDHFYPISKGGDDTISNLVKSCYKCNEEKDDYDPITYGISKIIQRDIRVKDQDLNTLNSYFQPGSSVKFIEMDEDIYYVKDGNNEFEIEFFRRRGKGYWFVVATNLKTEFKNKLKVTLDQYDRVRGPSKRKLISGRH